MTSAHPADDIRIFHKECVSLAKAGLEVFLVATNTEDQKKDGVNIIAVDIPKKGRWTRMLFTSKAVYNKALQLNADIYHFHDPELLRFALKLKKKGKIVIYDAHEDVPKQILDKYWIPGFARKLVAKFFMKYEMYISRRISGVVSVTEIICNRFNTVNSNVEMIANYPLLEEAKTLDNLFEYKQSEQICYVGALFEKRGVKELVESMEYCNARLVLAGTFSPPEFEAEVQALEGWRKVNYLGQINRNEILNVLKSSHVGIVTLHPTSSYQEALPIKMFEYMAAGIPVIASDFPLWRTILENENCGICVDPLNPREIGEAIEYLLVHSEMAAEMGANGKKAFQNKYNWEQEEMKLINFYKRLTSAL
jgi:glycosyltransferase involved in cell wall biosynthesis